MHILNRLFMSVLTLILYPSFVLAQEDPAYDPAIKNGQCYALVFSKKYMEEKSTPETVYYSCIYKCLDNDGNPHAVAAINSVNRKLSESDGSKMVCDGTQVTSQMVNGQRMWDFSGVTPFWAHLSKRPEIRKWAKANNIQLSKEEFEKAKAKFYNDILQTGLGFYLPSKRVKLSGSEIKYIRDIIIKLQLIPENETAEIDLKKFGLTSKSRIYVAGWTKRKTMLVCDQPGPLDRIDLIRIIAHLRNVTTKTIRRAVNSNT